MAHKSTIYGNVRQQEELDRRQISLDVQNSLGHITP